MIPVYAMIVVATLSTILLVVTERMTLLTRLTLAVPRMFWIIFYIFIYINPDTDNATRVQWMRNILFIMLGSEAFALTVYQILKRKLIENLVSRMRG